MQHQLTRQVRAITHLFAHLSKVSTQDLFRRFRLSTVLEMLHKEAHTLHQQLQHSETLGHTVADLHLNQARDTAARFQAWQIQPHATSVTASTTNVEAPFECHTCGRAYTTYRLLRVHESAEHSQKAPKADEVPIDRSLHSLGGIPTCKLCHHAFRQWDNLKQHIRRRCCHELKGLHRLIPDRTLGTGKCFSGHILPMPLTLPRANQNLPSPLRHQVSPRNLRHILPPLATQSAP